MNDCPDCDGDMVDEILETGAHWNYLTPAAELAGVNTSVLVVLALLLIAGVFLSHGILWG